MMRVEEAPAYVREIDICSSWTEEIFIIPIIILEGPWMDNVVTIKMMMMIEIAKRRMV